MKADADSAVKADGSGAAKADGSAAAASWAGQRERSNLLALRFMRFVAVAAGRRASRLMLHPIAFYFFGTAWITTLGVFAHRTSDWAIPSRLHQVGLPRWLALLPLVALTPLLVRSARRGRPRMALASMLVLVATPWLLPWYAAWVVPLAAVEEDRLVWVLALAFCAYILPDGIPL